VLQCKSTDSDLRREPARQNDHAQRALPLHPEEERIITIEDTAELQLQQRHVIKFEPARPILNKEGGHQPAHPLRTAPAYAARPHHRRRVPRRRRRSDMLQA
jgi:hypothetical protein